MAVSMKLVSKMTETVMEGVRTRKLGSAYQALCRSFPLVEIISQSQHRNALKLVGRLIDYLNTPDAVEIADDVQPYLAVLGDLVAKYERERFVSRRMPGREVLGQLMEMNGLNQKDLGKELGGQSVVSLILSGEREMNVGQIRALSRRFKVSPEVFL